MNVQNPCCVQNKGQEACPPCSNDNQWNGYRLKMAAPVSVHRVKHPWYADSQKEQQDPLPVSCSQQLPEQMPPVQQPDFAEAMTAQWEMHSSSGAPSPGRPQYKSGPAGPNVASRRPASVSSVASAASTPVCSQASQSLAIVADPYSPTRTELAI